MNPFDLIARYFKQNPEAQTIGTPAALEALAVTLLGIITPLPLFTLPDTARRQMSGKSAAGRRPRALKFARFLQRRPDFATKLDLPAQTYQSALDKDSLIDAMTFTFTYIREQVDHAFLILAGSVADRVNLVLDYVQKLATSEALLTDEQTHAVNAFADLVTEAQQNLSRDHKNQQDRARTQSSQQQQIDETQQQSQFQSLLSRLISDAQEGKDLSLLGHGSTQTK